MNKLSLTEFGALSAAGRAVTPQGARRPQAHFGAAFERAERVQREPAARPDRPEAKPEVRPEAKAPEAPEPKPEADQPQADAAEAAQADVAQAKQQADDAAADAAAQDAAEDEAMDADAALALMIATGIPAGPTATTPDATAAAGTAVDGVTAVGAGAETAMAAQLAALQAEATPTAPQPTATDAAAPATDMDALAAGLNVTGLSLEEAAVVTEPVAPTETPVNLGLALAAEAAEETQPETGSITPATTSDDAEGIEALSLQALPSDDDADDALVTDAPVDNAPTPLAAMPDRPAEPARVGASAPKPADPLPQPDEVMPQVLKGAEALKAQQNAAIKLQLYPEHLGKMEIKVVSHQGVLSAQLTADSQNVKAMLETQVASLQRSLQELGLKVDKVEVALSSQGAGGFDMGQQQAFSGGQQQQFGQQAPQRGYDPDLGYARWFEPETGEAEAAYAMAPSTAVDYVA